MKEGWLKILKPVTLEIQFFAKKKSESWVEDHLKGTTKATTEDVLKLNTLKGTKTAFLTPKRYDEQSRHFYMGVPHPLPPRPCSCIKCFQTTKETKWSGFWRGKKTSQNQCLPVFWDTETNKTCQRFQVGVHFHPGHSQPDTFMHSFRAIE